MGSFYKVCGISGITITDNEPCYVTRLQRQEHVYRSGPNVMEPDQEWQPISFPQLTKYYDYGMVDEEFVPSPLNAALGLNVSCDGEDKLKDPYFGDYRISDSLFLVHQHVYEKLSTSLLEMDNFYHYKGDIMDQGPQYFINGFNTIRKEIESESGDDFAYFKLGIKVEQLHLFGWRTSKIGQKILNTIMQDKDFTVFDELISAGIAEELYKQFIFEQNMNVLWKSYTPSNYGGQYDNYEAYDQLADIIKETAIIKKEFWDREYE